LITFFIVQPCDGARRRASGWNVMANKIWANFHGVYLVGMSMRSSSRRQSCIRSAIEAVPADWGPSLTKYRYVYSGDRVWSIRVAGPSFRKSTDAFARSGPLEGSSLPRVVSLSSRTGCAICLQSFRSCRTDPHLAAHPSRSRLVSSGGATEMARSVGHSLMSSISSLMADSSSSRVFAGFFKCPSLV
jgi:hypothetical protein